MHTQAVYRYSCMPALERLLSTNEIHLRISSYTTKLYDLYSTFTPFEHISCNSETFTTLEEE